MEINKKTKQEKEKAYYEKSRENINKKKRERYELNKDKINMNKRENRKKLEVKQKEKEYRNKPKSIKLRKESRKKYNSREDIKEKRNLDRKKRREIDENYAVRCRLRKRFYVAITEYTKTGKIKNSKDYDIDYGEIIEHLKPFPKNREKYHIDHIVPLVLFNLNNLNEVKIAFAPENHQWLLASENQSKGAKTNWVVKRK